MYLPFHMHINLELIDCTAMLIEVSFIEQYLIIKHFYILKCIEQKNNRLLDHRNLCVNILLLFVVQ